MPDAHLEIFARKTLIQIQNKYGQSRDYSLKAQASGDGKQVFA